MNFSNLDLNLDPRKRIVEPIELFNSLTLRGTIDNVWGPQEKALSLWDKQRDEKDIAIEMPTGGGKTLVGLIVAQSLLNEGRGPVLYVVPTHQLVEQTCLRAGELGLPVASYSKQKWTNQVRYDERTAICITNYAAVFHGYSKFRDAGVAGLVLDDAHTAADAIRDCFSIKIAPSDDNFRKIASIFRQTFIDAYKEELFDRAMSGDPLALLFVPMQDVFRKRGVLKRALEDAKIYEHDNNKFPWGHLQSHLHCCCVLIGGLGIEITPPSLPMKHLKYFDKKVKRVYMTATMPQKTEFIRTFGVLPISIQPGGKSGEAQKLVLLAEGDTDEDQRRNAHALTNDNKACIVCPSNVAATNWPYPAELYDVTSGDSGIREFAGKNPPAKLVLAGRFDGIDLPGKSCQILVLDGLPKASSLLRRFLDQSLAIDRLRTAHTSIKVIQAIGRIFRSNTDHGAVVIVGTELQRWLRAPENRRLLPALLQRQVRLGLALHERVQEEATTQSDLLQAVLSGGEDWDEYYESNLRAIEPEALGGEPSWLSDSVLAEAEALNQLWVGNFSKAREAITVAADLTMEIDKGLWAWGRHWAGLIELADDQESEAIRHFQAASNVRADLGRVKLDASFNPPHLAPGPQALNIQKLLQDKAKVSRLRKYVIANLKYGDPTNPCEEAISNLGELIGLEASRPDKQTDTGPDVVWEYPSSKSALGLEAKTNKVSGPYKKKEEIGQCHDHLQWMENSYKGWECDLVVIGPLLEVSKEANPPEKLRICPLEGLKSIAERVEELYVATSSLDSKHVEQRIEGLMRSLGLVWPMVWESLPGSLATDLQSRPESAKAPS